MKQSSLNSWMASLLLLSSAVAQAEVDYVVTGVTWFEPRTIYSTDGRRSVEICGGFGKKADSRCGGTFSTEKNHHLQSNRAWYHTEIRL